MKSLERRLNKIEDKQPEREPCRMVFQILNGSYRIGNDKLTESEFQEYEKKNRVIVMEPIS
ncbi:hypothetical protein ACG2F4_14420 [Halalkalibaculum sp. DA3122]|uniref:hypothetical protein n=1 Tax=Halalkalibaculum sp. DA3122 TaxID=3373607 RepID=UPI0037550524